MPTSASIFDCLGFLLVVVEVDGCYVRDTVVAAGEMPRLAALM